jgi:transposase
LATSAGSRWNRWICERGWTSLFVNKRTNRMKVLVHDGFGLWLCARRLYEGGFIRAVLSKDLSIALTHEQVRAIVVGLSWERLDERIEIRVL